MSAVIPATLAATAAGLVVLASLGYPILPTRQPRHGGSWLQRRQQWLRQAGSPVTVSQYMAVSIGTGVTVGIVVTAVTGVPLFAVAPALISALAPHTYWSARRRKHLAEVRRAWPEGLADLAAAVRALRPLQFAISDLAVAGPPALQRAFRRFPALMSQIGVVPALAHIAEDLADPTSDRIIEVLKMAAVHRPDRLPDLLAELGKSVTADLRTEDEIHTRRLEPQITAVIVGASPWVMAGLALSSHPLMRDYYQDGRGTTVVLFSLASTIAGIGVVRLLSRDPVEPRVFGDPK